MMCPCVSAACKLFVADSGVLGALIVRQSEVYLWRVGEGRVPQWWKVSVSAVLVWPLPPEMGVQVCFYGHQVRRWDASVFLFDLSPLSIHV